MRRFLSALLVASVTIFSTPSFAQFVTPAGFAQDRYTDFKADPSVKYGTLPNGMRYAIQKWSKPAGEVSIRFRIAAGSLMEADDQSGLAHFLEHMAFNGSDNVPEGELVKTLTREGLAFGPDTNAYTSWDETVYQLDLPHADKLQLGVSLMRETAGRLTISASAIERERGVIQSEERARNNPGYRQFKAWVAHALDGTMIPARVPIGDMNVIRSAARERFTDLYARYYTPNRAFLVIVGDVDPAAAEAVIKSEFSNWAQPAQAGADPAIGTLKSIPGRISILLEPQSATSVSLFNTKPYVDEPDTSATRRKSVLRGLAEGIVNTRLEKIARLEGAPITSAAISTGTWFKTARNATIEVQAKDPSNWKQALEIADMQLRQALTYGFTAEEFRVQLADTREAYRRAAAQAGAKRSAEVVDTILSNFSDDSVLTTDLDDLAWFEKTLPSLNAQAALAELKEVWGAQTPQVFLSTGAAIDGSEATVKSAYEAARARQVDAPQVETTRAWDYTKFGRVGQVVSTAAIPDLGVTRFRFANNVRLVVKPTKFEEGRVRVSVRFGDGQLTLPPSKPGLAFAIQSAFVAGGLGHFDVDALGRTLAGRSVSTGFGVGEDAFSFGGSTTPSDLTLQLQVFAAYMTDPAWRPDGLARLKASKDAIYRQIDATPGGVWGIRGEQVLRSGDARFAFPTASQFDALNLADAKAAIDAARRNSAIEIVIVGDTSVEAARAAVARTFGALPMRLRTPPLLSQERKIHFPAGRGTSTLEHKGRVDQSLAMIYWPMRDYGDGQEARSLRVLSEILQNRLTEVIREDLAESYSPSADWAPSPVFTGYGVLGAAAEVKPGDADKVIAAMERIAADLAAGKIEEDLFKRARAPLIADFDETIANNPWWISSLSNLSFEPQRIVRARDGKKQYASTTLEQVKALAKRYLDPTKARIVKVVPGPDAKAVTP